MHLNDRLSTYIDRVRQLESENQRLTYQVRTTEETVVKVCYIIIIKKQL